MSGKDTQDRVGGCKLVLSGFCNYGRNIKYSLRDDDGSSQIGMGLGDGELQTLTVYNDIEEAPKRRLTRTFIHMLCQGTEELLSRFLYS